MEKKVKKYVFFGAISILILGIIVLFPLFLAKKTQAGSGDNVSGWAWSENIGWISFNSTSDGSSVDYGVNVNLGNGKFSGYAWSENIGWLSFNEIDTGPPPSNDPCADASCIAKITSPGQLGKSDVYIDGWARALAYDGGWDGWIRFDHGQSGEVYIDKDGDFHGWAWGSDVVGWISFNSSDPGAGGAAYKVILNLVGLNNPPSAINLSVTQGNYCGVPYPPVYLSWEYSDPDNIPAGTDPQSAYQVQVDNNSNFSSPEIDSGKVASGSSEYAPINLSYNTTYFWRVMVWDSRDVSSVWAYGPSFTTPLHPYPSCDFEWSPQRPALGEVVDFTDKSLAYGGATIINWSWIFENGDPSSSSEQNASTTFIAWGTGNQNQVSLRVTDNDGFSCSTSKLISFSLPLPWWKEIIPF